MKWELYASVAAIPKSLTDSAKPIASADQIAGARIGASTLNVCSLFAPCTRAASSNSCPSPASAAETARNANGTERRPSRSTTPNGPSTRCVSNEEPIPIRARTP